MFGEFAPIFQWGFSIRRPKHFIPLLGSNLVVYGSEAVGNTQPLTRAFADGAQFSANHSQSYLLEEPGDVLFESDDEIELPRERASSMDTKSSPVEAKPIPSSPLLRARVPGQKKKSSSKDNLKSISLSSKSASAPSSALNATSTSSTTTTSCGMQSPPTTKRNSRVVTEMTDDEIVAAVESGELRPHLLEAYLGDCERAVKIRRRILNESLKREEDVVGQIPYSSFDYTKVQGQCCENVIGYVSVPVGIAGPLLMNGELIPIPMATTEGCLVASTHRGCKALNSSGGVTALLLDSGMTRAPVVRLPNAVQATKLKAFVEGRQGFELLRKAFNSTSNYARLKSIKVALAGRTAYLRFKSSTGDAMGMNMVSKGAERALNQLSTFFPELVVLSLSGNYCTDKKSAAINWVEGRGRSVVCEATIPRAIVEDLLKTTVDRLVELNIHKNLVGSGMAGTIGGYNAHASNIVTAIFLACGQDIAQTVESSNCITLMDATLSGDLQISITMPSIEVGTIGGGTGLPGQIGSLDILGVAGPHPSHPGRNADKLALIVGSAVLAGELSLMSALAAGHLVRSHMRLNRSHDNLKKLVE